MRFFSFFILASTVATTFSCAASVRAQTFNFEGQNPTIAPITTYTETQGGTLFTLRREDNRGFNVTNNNLIPGLYPASFGAHSLTPYLDTTNRAFIGTFSTTLSGVSVNFGDFLPDADVFTLQAYSGADGAGTLVGSTSVNYGTGTLAGHIGSASLSGLSGFRSIRFIGGGNLLPNSVYYDNINVTPVPEPGEVATWGALGLTMTLGIVRGRRRQMGKA